jgi:hypothetical protein
MKNPRRHQIEVADRAKTATKGTRLCVLERDLSFDKKALERATYTKLEDIDTDLLVVIASIAYVDRLISRRRGTQWGRALSVSIPVYHAEAWERVQQSLCTLLRSLTGDAWTLTFVAREKRNEMRQEFIGSLSPDFSGSTVIPYSGGLDSFAMLARIQHEEPNTRALLVNARGSVMNESLARPRDVSVIGVPFEFKKLKRPEPSYRTRTFTYFSLAALAWRRNRGSRIVIGESGIGCLGPSLVPFGIEQPVRGSHPSFTDGLSQVLGSLWGGTPPPFSFPHLWQTKAMVLSELANAESMRGWKATRSCSRNHKRQHSGAKGSHCGVCTGCLFRRVSLAAAGFASEDSTTYFEDVMTRASLRKEATKGDREVGICAVIAMQELALLALQLGRMTAEVSDLASALRLPIDTTRSRLQTLIERHRDEWGQFVSKLPAKSWIHPVIN